ncbi:MAG TPA: nucleotidyltransferase domain-containing protein [Egibacteraceae bacterium]|nr:nucleotidyltransferase domain-containing protein [Egibacteraceae bacterium]
MLRWPDAATVDEAVRSWARRAAETREDVLRIGYFGSYARGQWGVGSDIDLVVIVSRSDRPFDTRAAAWDTTVLPVPADLLVYTVAEWEAITSEAGFARTAAKETVWVYERAPSGRPG